MIWRILSLASTAFIHNFSWHLEMPSGFTLLAAARGAVGKQYSIVMRATNAPRFKVTAVVYLSRHVTR
jgi:hypothetical protein